MAEVHRVHVRLARYERTTFPALVSALHRRAVDVLEAGLDAGEGGIPSFTVTFRASRERAATLRATLGNLVDVLDAELAAPGGPALHRHRPPGTTRPDS